MARRARHTPTLSGNNKIRALSLDSALFAHVGDVITQLTHDWEWAEVGDSVADVVDACKLSVESWYSDMLIGAVCQFIVGIPSGWLQLDGSTYDGDDYPELYALLPSHLKSAGNFTLPDMEDAFSYAVDLASASAILAGSNSLTLTVGQLPSHNHTYIPPVVSSILLPPAGVPVPNPGIGIAINTGNTGSGDTIDRRPSRVGFLFAVFSGRGS